MTHRLDIPEQRQHNPEQQVRGREVRALRIDTDGHLTELVYRGREHHALREPLGTARSRGGPGVTGTSPSSARRGAG